jgi:hypothetical protein
MASVKRKKTPLEVETQVLLKSVRRCTLCFHLSGDLTEKHGQIAHLDQDPSNFDEDNLAWMCLVHHTPFDSKTSQHKNYTTKEVKAARSRLHESILQNKHLVMAADAVPALRPFLWAEREPRMRSQRRSRSSPPMKAVTSPAVNSSWTAARARSRNDRWRGTRRRVVGCLYCRLSLLRRRLCRIK